MSIITKTDRGDAPPPVICSSRVVAYAVVDKDVHFTGRQVLYVGDKLLGRMPKIAICKDLQRKFKGEGCVIFYCNRNWREVGISKAASLSLAKKKIERYYSGISQKWINLNTSEKAAKRWLIENVPQCACSFCGDFYYDFESMFSAASAVICSSCVRRMADELESRNQT